MKKALCILLVFAAIFALSACGKNGEIYTEPPTEIITFENGSTAVYEIVTDQSGEAVTDENGEKEVILYDPPVTEKGGYLVTDPEGSTVKQSQTTAVTSIAIENEVVDLDSTTAAQAPSETQKGETTTMKPYETTTLSSALEGVGSTEATTYPSFTVPEAETKPLGDALSKEDARILISILSFDNTFDEALCVPDYYLAETEINIYIDSIEKAIEKIKAEKKLYKFVGDENLQLWLDYMLEAKEEYAVFMGMVRGTEGMATKPATYYAAYENFQNVYRQSLKVYYFMKVGAEEIIYG